MGARMFMEKSADEDVGAGSTSPSNTYPDAGLAWFIGAGIQLQRGPYAGRLIVPGSGKEIEEPEPQHSMAA